MELDGLQLKAGAARKYFAIYLITGLLAFGAFIALLIFLGGR